MDFKRQSLVFQFVEKEEDLYFLIQIRKRTNRKGRLDDFKLQSYMYVSSKYKEMDRSKNDREVKKKLCVWA